MNNLGQLRIEYDDDVLNIIAAVNVVLERYGLMFESDELPHDGYEIFTLVSVANKATP